MILTRREAIVFGAGLTVAVLLPASAARAGVEDAIAAFTGGAEVTASGALTLTTPEIAENGNTVPVSVAAPGAVAIMILATGNPNPDVGVFTFGPMAASQSAATRIRLAGTQEVMAIAKMGDGSFVSATNTVKVTIGGCGG